MCSGKTHTTFNISTGFVVAVSLTIFAYMEVKMAILLFLSCALASLFLSPDLDLPNSKSQMAWGWFRWIWWPYHKAFNHRGVSHMVIVGTLTRVLYLAVSAFLILYLLEVIGNLWIRPSFGVLLKSLKISLIESGVAIVKVGRYYIKELLIILIGFVLADALHILSDTFCSLIAKKKPKKA